MALVSFPFINALFYLGFLMALISWILIIIKKNYSIAYIMKIPLARELAILLLISTITLFYVSDLSYGVRYWSMILQAFLSYLMIYEVIDSKELIMKFKYILLIAVLLVASYGIYGYLVGMNKDRAISFFTNPNYLSVYLLIFIPISLGLAAEESLSKGKRFLSVIVFIVSSIALVMALSRGAWLGTIVALVLFAILKDKRFLLLLLIVALIVPFIVPDNVINRFKSITSINSNMDRINLWSITIEIIKDNPLLGVGIGNFRNIYAEYTEGKPMIHSHNIFMQFTVELGIPGLLFIIYFIYLLCKIALTVLKSYDFNKEGGGLVLGTVMSLLALLIDLQFDFQIIDRPTAMLTLFLVASLVFLARDYYPFKQLSGNDENSN